MKSAYLTSEKPVLTVMLQYETPEEMISVIENSIKEGAEAFGFQVESLKPEYHTPEVYKKIITAAKGLPIYATYYRSGHNEGKTDDQLAEGIVELAKAGATLCDVIGDIFCKHPEELTDNEEAIAKQIALIDKLHALGAEVLISSHLYKYAPAERVMEIAFEQKRRGADVIKIVTKGDTMAEQMENLRINTLLKEQLGAKFLYLSGGECCSIHRRLSGILGSCTYLCVYKYHPRATMAQPLLRIAKAMRDEMEF